MRSLLVALFLLLALPAPAQDDDRSSPLGGVWVPGELLQALRQEEPGSIPCYLVIESTPELQVLEDCGGGRTRWRGALVEEQRAGRIEVRAEENRRLVFRAGAPNELELARREPGAEEAELLRLYRLPAALEDRLRSWAAAQQLLVGSWATEEGAEVEFHPDGTYRLAQERGRYQLQAGAPVPGAWGVLELLPREGSTRFYLLTGGGRRLGLALPPAHLVPRLRGEAEAEGAAGASGQQERGVLPEDLAAGGAGGAGAAGGAGGAPERELEVAMTLTRTGPGVEQQPTATAAPPQEEPRLEGEQPREPPPISRPIEPRGRCGCGAAEGGLGLAALLLYGLASLRRRQQDGPSGRRA